MLRIAITGSIACGKSSVASIVSDEGIPVCEADDLAHKEIMFGGETHGRICAEFGNDILDENGEISRERLGKIVFGNSNKLAVLNKIVHPGVKQSWNSWLAEIEENRTFPCAAVVIPLLYEIGDQGNWDMVICVAASKAVQLKRLKERSISEENAEARIKSQIAVVDKMGLADYVIVNETTRKVLNKQTRIILGTMLGR